MTWTTHLLPSTMRRSIWQRGGPTLRGTTPQAPLKCTGSCNHYYSLGQREAHTALRAGDQPMAASVACVRACTPTHMLDLGRHCRAALAAAAAAAACWACRPTSAACRRCAPLPGGQLSCCVIASTASAAATPAAPAGAAAIPSSWTQRGTPRRPWRGRARTAPA